MKRLFTSLVIIYALFVSLTSNAQKVEYGVFAGGNLNFVTVNSDYEINGEHQFKPKISYNVGFFLRKKINPINLLGSIEYLRTSNGTDIVFTNAIGCSVGDYTSNINNHSLLINIISTINISKGFYIGVGIAGNILVKSKMKFKDEFLILGTYSGKTFTNVSYKRFMFSIPLIVGYDFQNIGIFTRFNIGVMNRIKGDSYVKEYESPLILGVSYRFNKKNSAN